jgi:HlyD family secretion protein
MSLEVPILRRCVALGLAGAVSLGLGGRCGEPTDASRLVGTVERTLVEIGAATSEVIVAIPVSRGQHVEPGALLVRLDPLLARADLSAAAADVDAAQARTDVAQQEYRRVEALHERGVAATEALDRARLERDAARAALQAAMARMAAAQRRLNETELRAPVAGTVDQLPFDVGERVAAGAVVAVLLADGPPWVRVWLPEEIFPRVGPGTRATITIDGVGVLRGHVLDVAHEPAYTPHYALTERERTHLVYEARVQIDDAPPGLRPGAPAEVQVALAPPVGPAGAAGR